ncbi:substrate-binding domain-containing protein [Litorivicinus lipolyticus]|uniref:Substrate-binding domain-containing protein n=1 Tax=Litorivicinus lipolyticus TaxID=418701 RepID=A0A5Q2QD45_9GAMM|nr:sugar ABC transporter substrate-binding protein [Litorivicinus lipolyticus]QGG79907.1 substrate-binding domain-containing protein [Litorivicinus lipolyticus]
MLKPFSKLVLAGALVAGVTLHASAVTVGYITKSATNSGWIMINQGASDAAKEMNAKLITVGPAFQGDLASQLEVFENLSAQGVDAIAVAPVDSSGIAPAVEAAMEAGIVVVAIDTGVSGAEVTSFVATDNEAVATIQGAEAAKLVADGDKIIYVTGNQAQSTGQERRDGFMAGFKAARPNSEILLVPTEWNSDQAQAGVEALLNNHSDVKMVVNAWDGGTMGAKAALENLGFGPGDVKLVGFDGASDAIVAMDAGWVQVDTAQMLYQMGYQGIKTAVSAAGNMAVDKRIDTGTFLVTPETSAEYKALIGM